VIKECLEFLLPKGGAMYEKIVVAVDHSEVTPRVLNAAQELASLSHGEVWVLNLREREPMGKTGLLMSTESRDEASEAVTTAVEGSRRMARSGTPSSGMPRARS
jgi:nucleotide-binding universal stress UspA family protein